MTVSNNSDGYKERPRCPFYGFSSLASGALVDSRGNQCALEISSYRPCRMEMDKQTPCWDNCSYNNPENSGMITEHGEMRVFPEELKHPERKNWQGVTLKDWMDKF